MPDKIKLYSAATALAQAQALMARHEESEPTNDTPR